MANCPVVGQSGSCRQGDPHQLLNGQKMSFYFVVPIFGPTERIDRAPTNMSTRPYSDCVVSGGDGRGQQQCSLR